MLQILKLKVIDRISSCGRHSPGRVCLLACNQCPVMGRRNHIAFVVSKIGIIQNLCKVCLLFSRGWKQEFYARWNLLIGNSWKLTCSGKAAATKLLLRWPAEYTISESSYNSWIPDMTFFYDTIRRQRVAWIFWHMLLLGCFISLIVRQRLLIADWHEFGMSWEQSALCKKKRGHACPGDAGLFKADLATELLQTVNEKLPR